MNILLIRPCWPYPYSVGENTYNRIWPPLSLLNCAGILQKEGLNVEVLDAHAMRINSKKLINYIVNCDKVFITSSALDRWQCPNENIDDFVKTASSISQICSETYVMGYHGTIEPEKILRLTGAKAVIRGEPEYSVSEICCTKEVTQIKGVSYWKDKEIVHNPERESFDLKEIPLPGFGLIDFRKYAYEILGGNFALFEISRGCNYRCEFCDKVMYGDGVRVKSAEQVCKELKIAVEEHKVRNGYFIDLEFLSNKEIVNRICEFLIEKKYDFKWCCQLRPDIVESRIIKKMKKAGCSLVHLGVESGSQNCLDRVKKDVSLETIERAVRICKNEGVKTLAFYMVGIGETNEEREKLIEFSRKLDTDYVSFHKFINYRNKINRNEKRLDKFLRRAYIRYYLAPAKLIKMDIFVMLNCIRLFFSRIRSIK